MPIFPFTDSYCFHFFAEFDYDMARYGKIYLAVLNLMVFENVIKHVLSCLKNLLTLVFDEVLCS